MADFFDIQMPQERQDAAVQKVKQFLEEQKKKDEKITFDLIGRTFSAGGYAGRWNYAQKFIRIYIEKRPKIMFIPVPMSKIEKAIREFVA